MKASDILDFLLIAGRLKNIPRTGWVISGITDPETVASHSFRVALISMLLSDYFSDINKEKVLRIALIHDLNESIIGDIPLSAKDNVQIDEKKIFSEDIPIPAEIKERMVNDFAEFEDRTSTEGMIVRAADKIDLLLQAYEYEKNRGVRLNSFWENSQNRVDFKVHKIVEKIIEELERRRKGVN